MAGGESVFDEMERLNRRLTELPPGCISRKTINGKIRYYHQWYESGKIRSKYVKEADLSGLEARIAERKECEQHLKKLKDGLNPDVGFEGFKTSVIAGAPLLSVFDDIGDLKRRDCYGILESYVRGSEKKVCILYGLRRTGKTTMIGQLIRDMDVEELSRTAYMNAADAGTLRRVYWDLDVLRSKGFRTVFIDEITMLDDFIDGCSALATLYASMGMRIVLSGTDSLGLRFAEDDQLYCRAVTIHMNPIRYREHARLMGTGDIDDFSRREYVFTAGFPKYEIKRSLSDRVVRERDSEANAASFSKEASQRQFLLAAVQPAWRLSDTSKEWRFSQFQ